MQNRKLVLRVPELEAYIMNRSSHTAFEKVCFRSATEMFKIKINKILYRSSIFNKIFIQGDMEVEIQ